MKEDLNLTTMYLRHLIHLAFMGRGIIVNDVLTRDKIVEAGLDYLAIKDFLSGKKDEEEEDISREVFDDIVSLIRPPSWLLVLLEDAWEEDRLELDQETIDRISNLADEENDFPALDLEKTFFQVRSYAESLKAARMTAKMTENELAEASGVSLSAIFSLEAGEDAPSWKAADALAKALGLSDKLRFKYSALVNEDQAKIRNKKKLSAPRPFLNYAVLVGKQDSPIPDELEKAVEIPVPVMHDPVGAEAVPAVPSAEELSLADGYELLPPDGGSIFPAISQMEISQGESIEPASAAAEAETPGEKTTVEIPPARTCLGPLAPLLSLESSVLTVDSDDSDTKALLQEPIKAGMDAESLASLKTIIDMLVAGLKTGTRSTINTVAKRSGLSVETIVQMQNGGVPELPDIIRLIAAQDCSYKSRLGMICSVSELYKPI